VIGLSGRVPMASAFGISLVRVAIRLAEISIPRRAL
jgi:hypothetical protein